MDNQIRIARRLLLDRELCGTLHKQLQYIMTQAGQDSALLRCRAVKVSSSTYVTIVLNSVTVYDVADDAC
jgi:hypothetical protein